MVQPEPLLSEVGYPGREEEAVALLRRLGDADHDAVACSQGDVIPDLLGRLAAADGYPVESPLRNRKGSTWALSIDADGGLVAADHLEAPRARDLCGGTQARYGGQSPARGTSIQKVDPTPSSDSTPTEPRCASAMWRTMASPSPALPPSCPRSRSRARERSTL